MNENSDQSKKEKSEIELRLEFLEKRYQDAHRFFRHILSAITIIFLFVGIIMTVLSIVSKQEVTDAIKDMERKFEILAGQALTKPLVEVYFENKPITGKTTNIEFGFERSLGGHAVRFPGLFIKNIGDKKAEDVTFHFYFSKKINEMGRMDDEGHYTLLYNENSLKASALEHYPHLLTLRDRISLNRLQPWDFPVDTILFLGKEIPPKVNVKLLIFYGIHEPAEANFTLIKK